MNAITLLLCSIAWLIGLGLGACLGWMLGTMIHTVYLFAKVYWQEKRKVNMSHD